jgi:hypothetical protein
MHEMPASHADLDLSTLTVEGLIKACPHYAGLAAMNPELARTRASDDLGHAREEARRQDGMSKEEKEDDFWSSMNDLVEKQAAIKVAPKDAVHGQSQGSARRATAEQRTVADQIFVRPQPITAVRPATLAPGADRADTVLTAKELSIRPIELSLITPKHSEVVTPLLEQLATSATRAVAAALERTEVPPASDNFTFREIKMDQPAVVDEISLPLVVELIERSDAVDDTSIELEESVEYHEELDLPLMSEVLEDFEPIQFDTEEEVPLSPAIVLGRFIESLDVAARTDTPGVSESEEGAGFSPELTSEGRGVLLEVAALLAVLTPEQEEQAAPIVQDITKSVEETRALHADLAPPETVAEAVERLTEQVRRLFEIAGGELDEEKIAIFVQAVPNPAFKINRDSLTPEELQYMGTHEVKLNFGGLNNPFGTLTIRPTSHIGNLAMPMSLPEWLWGQSVPSPV